MPDDSHICNDIDHASGTFASDNWKDPINYLVASGMPLDFLLSHVEEVYGNVEQLHDIMTLSELLSYSAEAYNAFHGL